MTTEADLRRAGYPPGREERARRSGKPLMPVTRASVDYLVGALRSIVGLAEHMKQPEIQALAQAGLDLAEHGEKACREMRGA